MRVTAVMHFAAWLAVGDSVRDPAGYYRNNVMGTLALLEAVVAESVAAFVLSSTCAVYGEPERTPIAEDHPTRPINAYGETKLAIERALPHYERAYGLRAIRLRYFNAAGADPEGELGEDHDPEIHLIPRAIAAARGGPALEVFGDRLPDARRHLPSRLHPRGRSGGCPSCRRCARSKEAAPRPRTTSATAAPSPCWR